jgi:DNA-binding response OmpR family regulator
MSKILLVEDDPLILRLYQNAFSLAGFEVEIAADGAIGLKKAKEVRPSLIILDVMMPNMNGLEVLDQLKSDPNTMSIPVIMLTNLYGEKAEETALKKGALMYLIKSDIDPQKVVQIVKNLVK